MSSTAATPSENPVSPPVEGRLWIGAQMIAPLPGLRDVQGGFVDFEGERCYRINEFDQLAPFLIPLLSASDHWLYLSSTGALTAGRGSPDHAVFPYQSVDRLHDSAGSAGPFALLLVERPDRVSVWEPFGPDGRLAYRLSRNLYKSVLGHRLWLEEINHDLGLTWSIGWATSERFGFVHRASLSSESYEAATVRVVHGLRNLLPPGIPPRLVNEMSCLTDAYKRAELLPDSSLAVFALSSGITDQPVALEALTATVAWSEGLPEARVLLSEAQLRAFRAGVMPRPEQEARGIRGVYGLSTRIELAPGAAKQWMCVCDIGLSQAAVVDLLAVVTRGHVGQLVRADLAAGEQRLRQLVGTADGLHCTGDEAADAHHQANVLFNLMRGGALVHGNEIPGGDFARFVSERSTACASRHRAWLAGLSGPVPRGELRRLVQQRRDADLERLFLEYLPLGFSRRHGDPSRPWNRFSIRLRDASGGELFEYEGNWRDIFQNWEALGYSSPELLEHMVAKFVNASTVDGHNPFRVTRRGGEWEVPAPDDPWAGIGYWGDHQVIYLLKLLEAAERFAPGRFHAWLDREVFSYAAVPYRIADYEQMRRDPRSTIRFLADADAAIRAREQREGADARLVRADDGRVRHVTLAEKLLLTALARLANLVPGGGIWMNTQRPEWNDANNALVGPGVSGVTLANLRRYLVFCRPLFAGLASGQVALSAAVARFADELESVLRETGGREEDVVRDPRARRLVVDALAGAGSRYRDRVYAHGLGERTLVPAARLTSVIDAALPLVEASLRALRRADGLYHGYRLMHFADAPTLTLDDLPIMLEGQVAALGSGLLSHEEGVTLLRALRRSPLYCPVRKSFLLYPDGSPPGFLERNIVSEALVREAPVLAELLGRGDDRVVGRDARGVVRFHPDLVNLGALDARLAAIAREPRWSEAMARGGAAIRHVYEQVFEHRAFTGRSGTMFAYEGLGSVYWHMVSKLLLAVQECHTRAVDDGHPAAATLAREYFEIRAGLGFNKSPAAWGAFPLDPHSHTPAHAGAQQPGMTGQVKEGILVRLGELGVRIRDGCLGFAPRLLRAHEFLAEARTFVWFDPTGERRELALSPGMLAFTVCGTAVVYRLGEGAEGPVVVTRADGRKRVLPSLVLSAHDSVAIFERRGEVQRVDVALPRTWLFES